MGPTAPESVPVWRASRDGTIKMYQRHFTICANLTGHGDEPPVVLMTTAKALACT